MISSVSAEFLNYPSGLKVRARFFEVIQHFGARLCVCVFYVTVEKMKPIKAIPKQSGQQPGVGRYLDKAVRQAMAIWESPLLLAVVVVGGGCVAGGKLVE